MNMEPEGRAPCDGQTWGHTMVCKEGPQGERYYFCSRCGCLLGHYGQRVGGPLGISLEKHVSRETVK